MTLQDLLNDEREQAMQEGIQEGIQIGIQTVAKNFLNKGIPLELIAEATGLSKEEIQSLDANESLTLKNE